jgi:6-pyruvoyltetrahydropterin/6-carboxytetrahydropterin synthase
MYTITKEFAFEASHRLLDMPEGHKCGRMHGHSYRVIVVLGCETLDKYGFVIDYGDLDPLKQYIDNFLDHRHLNDVLEMRQPTAEKIAEHIFDFCTALWNDKVLEVRVSETAKTWATYSKTYLKTLDDSFYKTINNAAPVVPSVFTPTDGTDKTRKVEP